MDQVNISLPTVMERQSTNLPESPVSPRTNKTRVWRSCCFECDKSAFIFICSYIMLGCLLCFFGAGLWTADSCESSNLYQSLMLLVLGVVLPSPRMK